MKSSTIAKILILALPLLICQCESFPDVDYHDVHVGIHTEHPSIADSLKITVIHDKDTVLQQIGTKDLKTTLAGNRLDSEYELQIEFFCNDQWLLANPYTIDVGSGVTAIYLTKQPEGFLLFNTPPTKECSELADYKLIEKNS
ncbi:MAG: hypothetical protein II819_05585 [Fibrobacter sp.]|nr:hypothetical protein [Fibrobacter sp.]